MQLEKVGKLSSKEVCILEIVFRTLVIFLRCIGYVFTQQQVPTKFNFGNSSLGS